MQTTTDVKCIFIFFVCCVVPVFGSHYTHYYNLTGEDRQLFDRAYETWTTKLEKHATITRAADGDILLRIWCEKPPKVVPYKENKLTVSQFLRISLRLKPQLEKPNFKRELLMYFSDMFDTSILNVSIHIFSNITSLKVMKLTGLPQTRRDIAYALFKLLYKPRVAFWLQDIEDVKTIEKAVLALEEKLNLKAKLQRAKETVCKQGETVGNVTNTSIPHKGEDKGG